MARWIGTFPLHGTGRFVVLTDVSHELSLQIRDGSEYTSRDDIALDLAEPQLDCFFGSVSQCREQARRVYYGAVFEVKKEIPVSGELRRFEKGK
jgi:hypothetical protein